MVGQALRHVEEQTVRICLEAIRQNPNALKYVENPSHKLYLELIKEDPLFVLEFDYQADEFYFEAIRSKPMIFKIVDKNLSSSIFDEVEMIYCSFGDEGIPKSYRSYRYMKATLDSSYLQSPYDVLEKIHCHY